MADAGLLDTTLLLEAEGCRRSDGQGGLWAGGGAFCVLPPAMQALAGAPQPASQARQVGPPPPTLGFIIPLLEKVRRFAFRRTSEAAEVSVDSCWCFSVIRRRHSGLQANSLRPLLSPQALSLLCSES